MPLSDIALLIIVAFQVDFPDHGGGCPHSYPFVTGDTFRAFADVAFDNVERLYLPGNVEQCRFHGLAMEPINLFENCPD